MKLLLKTFVTFVLGATIGLGLGGCEAKKGPAEKAGEKIDQAAEDAKEGVEDAAKATEEKAKEVGKMLDDSGQKSVTPVP